jgi:hypothetical protein
MEEADLYNNGQHGFRRNRSCLSQLLEHHHRLVAQLEEGAGVDVVSLDFAVKLLTKLTMGCSLESLGCWG